MPTFIGTIHTPRGMTTEKRSSSGSISAHSSLAWRYTAVHDSQPMQRPVIRLRQAQASHCGGRARGRLARRRLAARRPGRTWPARSVSGWPPWSWSCSARGRTPWLVRPCPPRVRFSGSTDGRQADVLRPGSWRAGRDRRDPRLESVLWCSWGALLARPEGTAISGSSRW